MSHPSNPTNPPLKGEWTTITINGRTLTVWCIAPEPVETLNAVEVYLSVTECLKKALLKPEGSDYNYADIKAWLSKFPKPIHK